MSNFKDITVSFTNLLKSKVRNPLYGTIILLYLIRNHEYLYRILFLKTGNQYDNLNCLNELLYHKKLIFDIYISTLYAFFAMAISFFLMNISKLIKGIFDNVIDIYVQKVIDKLTSASNTYSKDEFLRIEKEKNDFEKRFIHEKETRIQYQNEILSLEKHINELKNPENFNKKFLEKIKNKKLLDSFRKITAIINADNPLTDLEKNDQVIFNLLISNRMIKRTNRELNYYDFTSPKGEEFINHFNNWNESPGILSV